MIISRKLFGNLARNLTPWTWKNGFTNQKDVKPSQGCNSLETSKGSAPVALLGTS